MFLVESTMKLISCFFLVINESMFCLA